MRISDEEMRAAVDRMTVLAIRAALSLAEGLSRAARPLVIVNPAARNGAVGQLLGDARRDARRLGVDAETRAHRARRATRASCARGRLRDGPRLVVAVGGDGTVNEVVNGFFDGGPADRARGRARDRADRHRPRRRAHLRHPGKPERALALLADGATRTIDLGRATYTAHAGGEESRLFLNIASCGLSGAVAERANRTSKRLGGTPAFLWATVATFAGWKNVPFTSRSTASARELVANNTIVANGRYFGGGMKIAPDAEPGRRPARRDRLRRRRPRSTSRSTCTGCTAARSCGHPKASHRLARTVSVEPARPLPIEIDGEQPGVTPVRFEVVPAALRLRVPAA